MKTLIGELSYQELRNRFRAIWGGVSWPSKRPGFCVIVGMEHKRHFDSGDLYVLDEYESFDMRQIVRRAGALSVQYAINPGEGHTRFIGDYKNDAASRFIQEMNAEQHQDAERFSLSSTSILERKNLYQSILPEIKALRSAERRQLFLSGSQILNYMAEIELSELAELKRGDFPALEALAFCVVELRGWAAAQDAERQAGGDEDEPYDRLSYHKRRRT